MNINMPEELGVSTLDTKKPAQDSLPSNCYTGQKQTHLAFIISSVQFSRSVVSNSLQTRESQHARPPCPSPTPGVYSDSCPLSQWCHLTVSSIVEAFTSRLQSFPGSGSFPMNQWPKFWRFSFSISPSNEYSGLISIWIGWLDLLAIQGD